MTIHNFSPGPAALPKEVLLQVQKELLNWQGRGYSVMEVSHRSPQYIALVDDTVDRLRSILTVPDNYSILFLSLPATGHFGTLPLNFSANNTQQKALYLNTGHWSKKATAIAKKVIEVDELAISPDEDIQKQLDQSKDILANIGNSNYVYAHFCPNETIEGRQWPMRPNIPDNIPLIGDFSSCLLSTRLKVSNYAMIYAGAQKNIGPAGVSVAIIRDDLLEKADSQCPDAFHYALQAKNNSLLHTPNTFGIYVINLVCQWLEKQGGLEAMEKINEQKAARLYDCIDQSELYINRVPESWRSIMNIPFQLTKDNLDAVFLQEAEKQDLLFLKGHRAVGGMRANLYNAVEQSSVQALIDFMASFAIENL